MTQGKFECWGRPTWLRGGWAPATAADRLPVAADLTAEAGNAAERAT